MGWRVKYCQGCEPGGFTDELLYSSSRSQVKETTAAALRGRECLSVEMGRFSGLRIILSSGRSFAELGSNGGIRVGNHGLGSLL